ncbi:MAG: MEDS domain-containing protein [Archaeoglobus sp.]|nr:MEDS domain-containing protein [Archaeoglobus sp.]
MKLAEPDNLTFGDHICFIYRNRDEQLSLIIPFIVSGLEKNEKCIYISENSKEDLIRALEEHVRVDRYLDSGQLALLTKNETKEDFDPDWMIDLVKEAEKRALEEDYSALRYTAEIPSSSLQLEKLIEYEAKLNYFFSNSRCIAICQYSENKAAEILIAAIHTHPKIIFYDSLVENPYYIPPDVFLTKMRPLTSRELYRILRSLIFEKAEIEKKRKERKLRRAGKTREATKAKAKMPHDHLYSIVQSIPSAIFVVDRDKRITLWNSAAEKLTGLKGEEVIGRRCNEALKTDCVDCKLFDENVEKPFTTKCEMKINGTKWILKTVDYLKDEDGEIIGGIEAFQDITDRVEMEESLKRSEAKYRDLFENSLDIIAVTNLKGEFIDVNKAFEEVLGYSREEVIGKSFVKVIGSKENSDFIFKKYNEAFREKKDLYGLKKI